MRQRSRYVGTGPGFPPEVVQIARFRPADNEAVAELILHVQQVEFGLPLGRDVQPDLWNIGGAFRGKGSRFWVAQAMDAVIGSVGLHDMGGGNGEVRRMFVAAAWRGGPHHVADQLLTTLLTHAAARRTHTLWLGTSTHFLAAHRFYEKHDFRRVGAAAVPPGFIALPIEKHFYARPVQL